MELESICKNCIHGSHSIEFQSIVQVQTQQGVMQGISTRQIFDCERLSDNMLRHEFGVVGACSRFEAKPFSADISE